MIKIDTKKIKNIPFAIAEHAFWVCLILFIISLAISFFLFYKYNSLAQKQIKEDSSKESVFDRDVYNKVLSIWDKQEGLFNSVDKKEYIDPFLKPID